MSQDLVIGVVCLVFGGLIGYVVAAHNSKANKDQVAALEAKVGAVVAQVQSKVDSTVAVDPVAATSVNQTPNAVVGTAEVAPATVDQSVAK